MTHHVFIVYICRERIYKLLSESESGTRNQILDRLNHFHLKTRLCLCLLIIHSDDNIFSHSPNQDFNSISFSFYLFQINNTQKEEDGDYVAAKRKTNAATVVIVEKQHPKRKHVVLGELPNLLNVIVPTAQNPHKEKLQCQKNPNRISHLPQTTPFLHPRSMNLMFPTSSSIFMQWR